MENTIKYVARFKVETNTPLSIGGGKDGLLNERLVARDANGLPYLPATGLAGVVRHELERLASDTVAIDAVFGYQDIEDGRGSRIAFTDGVLLSHDDQTVMEGVRLADFSHPYFSALQTLPSRDHVRIEHTGVASLHGKFEERLVHRGVRFVFEIELEGNKEDAEIWTAVLAVLNDPAFRLGGGVRKGFGQLKVLFCHERLFDLSNEQDLIAYLEKDNALNASLQNWKEVAATKSDSQGRVHFLLNIEPESFFLFGAGASDEAADDPPKKERFFQWLKSGPVLSDEYYLIPATSVKGALSHRTAYHYNRLKGQTIESLAGIETRPPAPVFSIENGLQELDAGFNIETIDMPAESLEWRKLEEAIQSLSMTDSPSWQRYLEALDELESDTSFPAGEGNAAVRELFGYAKNSDNEEAESGARGRVILSDLYISPQKAKEKVFNHVSIDRFTGGARTGALFTQKVLNGSPGPLDIFVEETAFETPFVREAFEAALDDLTHGMLPLGGSTTKGQGAFKGQWKNVSNHE